MPYILLFSQTGSFSKKCASPRTIVPESGCGGSRLSYACDGYVPEDFCSTKPIIPNKKQSPLIRYHYRNASALLKRVPFFGNLLRLCPADRIRTSLHYAVGLVKASPIISRHVGCLRGTARHKWIYEKEFLPETASIVFRWHITLFCLILFWLLLVMFSCFMTILLSYFLKIGRCPQFLWGILPCFLFMVKEFFFTYALRHSYLLISYSMFFFMGCTRQLYSCFAQSS